jgi:hypothetical protein
MVGLWNHHLFSLNVLPWLNGWNFESTIFNLFDTTHTQTQTPKEIDNLLDKLDGHLRQG